MPPDLEEGGSPLLIASGKPGFRDWGRLQGRGRGPSVLARSGRGRRRRLDLGGGRRCRLALGGGRRRKRRR